MRGVNKTIIIGHLGADPDLRYTQNGNAVANISVATDESYKDRQTGQMVPRTEWHRIVLWNKTAEVAGQYLRKGSPVYIEGRLATRKWQDQSGIDRFTTEIKAYEMQMLPAGQGNNGGQRQAPPSADQTPAQAQHQAPPPVDDFDDDIPF